MADTTSHDTIGASTLATPLFMPSSPPGPNHDLLGSPERSQTPASEHPADKSRLRNRPSPGSSRASSPDRALRELEARLAEYTVDFSQFPSGQQDFDEDLPDEPRLPHEEDRLSDVAGPEDFTANLERYLMGEDDTDIFEHKEVEKNQFSEPQKDREEQEVEQFAPAEEVKQQTQPPTQPQDETHAHEEQQQQSSQLHQPAIEDEPELGEYSEFGPPVDMSTPSHLLRRPSGLAKDVTHLANIEENPDDDLGTAATPSVRKQRTPSLKEGKDTDGDLRRRIADLQRAVRDRDEQLERNHRRVLEAASAGEQIKHLQAELQRKTSLLDELHAKRGDETLLREQIQLLQKQNDERESFLQRSSISSSELSALQKQIGDMHKEMQNRNSSTELESERLETITHLRQQLTMTQEQVKKRDSALDETLEKLQELTTVKEQQLRENNTMVDGLRAQIDDQVLEIERLETDLERANQAYHTLEDRISSLETKNRPLEEKNSTLEADLSRAQSQMTAQENALKAMAADLPVETGGNTYTEILELIKDLGQPTTTRPADVLMKEKGPVDPELELLREEITKLHAELKDASSVRKAMEMQATRSQEQTTEAHTLINSIESENTRLSRRAEDLKANLDKANRELAQVKDAHSEALGTIQRLQEEKKKQQPSPPPSPPVQRQKESALEETHQAQLQSLQTAHATAISTLRTSHADSTRKLRDLLSAAEKRESNLQADLQSLRTSRSNQGKDLQSLRAEIERLESVIAVKDETAAAVDQRIARSVEKREKEWERRVDLLLKERERMSRALMWSWGEKEVKEPKEPPLDEQGRRKQGYKYKYAQKSGSAKKV
ncbi:putative spindle pole body associated protein SnaD [Aspergillus melleus]|uniref:putative spindle pole body associated protein SnaD n=1 Tax=Aspergillus melleus TaxID=138277 RepID=UPI001E8D5DA8|nr:uncharacterized protein LDX57_008093 [Aspergillus melleus]KAH8430433.1 hypothetical protein LDX57_008093 [Aspergillus melleus]